MNTAAAERAGVEGESGDGEGWEEVAEEWASGQQGVDEGDMRGDEGGGPEEWEEALDDELWAGADEPFGDG